MTTKRCAACGKVFKPWPQVQYQQFCSDTECQRERRRRKQIASRKSNPLSKVSDAQYFRDWADKNPNYWKQYRAEHPEYVERNRNRQRKRNQASIAKDALNPPFSLPTGRYRLIPVCGDEIANENVWIVEITVLSGSPET